MNHFRHSILGPSLLVLLALSCFISRGDGKTEKINRKLYIASILNPLANRNDTTIGVGLYERDVIKLLAERLNFTYQVVKLKNDESGGIYVNGTWTGVMGRLIRHEVDIFTTGQGFSSFRNRWVDSSYPIRFDEMVIIQPFPTEKNNAAMIRAFTWQVWLASAASAIVVILVLWFLQDPAARKLSLETWIMSYTSYILGQESAYLDRRTSTRIIYVVCFLTAVVMTSAFIAAYTARLTFPQHVYLVDSIDDLATKPDIKVYIIKGFTIENLFMGATEGSLKIIADRLEKNPDWKITVEQQNNLSQLIRGRVVLPQPGASGVSRLWNDYKITHECRLTLAKKSFYSTGFSMHLQKNSPLTPLVNHQMMRFYEVGLMDYVARRSYPSKVDPCTIEVQRNKRGKQDSRNRVIKLKDLNGAFLLLIYGLSLSTVVFVGELIVHRWRSSVTKLRKNKG